MNDKKVIEIYKSVRADLETLPRPLPPEAIEDIKRIINDGLAKAKADPKPETRSLSEVIAAIESDTAKSLDRKEFEIKLAQMADRMTHSKPVLPVSNEASQPEQANEPLPLHERIKFLRQS